MQHKFIFIFVPYLIFQGYQECVEALVGRNIRRAVQNEFPNVVCIMQYSLPPRDQRYDIKCTGTLITRDHVLTAQHCFNNMGLFSLYVLVGSVDIRIARTFFISWWITYELWATNQNITIEYDINDIAMIKLLSKVSETIVPAPISMAANRNLFGLDVVLAGWGKIDNVHYPNIMHTATVRIIGNRDCERVSERVMGYHIPIHSRYLCSLAEPPIHLNSGDSGGPVFYGNYILAVNQGTMPNVVNVGAPQKANMHFSVDGYRNFIERNMAI